jgi:phosphopantetheine--protein transferase-like protein
VEIQGAQSPKLSISHSNGYAVAVASWKQAIGVDLEEVVERSQPFLEEWFRPMEKALVGSDPLRQNLAWSAKEAVLKALGEGMALSPRDVELISSDRSTLEVKLHGQVAQALRETGYRKASLQWRLFEGLLWVEARLTA